MLEQAKEQKTNKMMQDMHMKSEQKTIQESTLKPAANAVSNAMEAALLRYEKDLMLQEKDKDKMRKEFDLAIANHK